MSQLQGSYNALLEHLAVLRKELKTAEDREDGLREEVACLKAELVALTREHEERVESMAAMLESMLHGASDASAPGNEKAPKAEADAEAEAEEPYQHLDYCKELGLSQDLVRELPLGVLTAVEDFSKKHAKVSDRFRELGISATTGDTIDKETVETKTEPKSIAEVAKVSNNASQSDAPAVTNVAPAATKVETPKDIEKSVEAPVSELATEPEVKVTDSSLLSLRPSKSVIMEDVKSETVDKPSTLATTSSTLHLSQSASEEGVPSFGDFLMPQIPSLGLDLDAMLKTTRASSDEKKVPLSIDTKLPGLALPPAISLDIRDKKALEASSGLDLERSIMDELSNW